MIVDCGVQNFEYDLPTNDIKVIGEFIGFNIQRLDVWAKKNDSYE